MNKNKITLIGMAGVGKSSIGKKLASELNYSFIDTDTVIHAKINQSLYEFISEKGSNAFLKIENNTLLTLDTPPKVIIATGGSAVYNKEGMEHLQKSTHIIYLEDNFENIQKRIKNSETRGIVSPITSDLFHIYNERLPLYKKYAHTTITLPTPFNLSKSISLVKKTLNI